MIDKSYRSSDFSTNKAYRAYKKRELEWKKQNENNTEEVAKLQKEVEELKGKLNSQLVEEVKDTKIDTQNNSNEEENPK